MLKKILKYSFLALAVVVLWGLFSYYQGINLPGDEDGVLMPFTVERGEGVNKVAANLAAKKIIKAPLYFRIYVWRAGQEKALQAGTYQLSSKMSIKKIVSMLAGGEVVSEDKEITFIPGWNLRDVAEELQRPGISTLPEFFAIAGEPLKTYKDKPLEDFSDRFASLADKPKDRNLEGYLFPDTYRLKKDARAKDAVLAMLSNFDRKLTAEARAEVKRQGKTIYQIVTMASVIEKEVRSEKDMKTVSGIFWNRIKNGQPLESCATLAYILGKNKPIYTLEDTHIDSPYNTYRKYGLPPGPISNPSLQAIEAAIYPDQTDFNYFLSRPDTGETVFSKTYAEHLKNQDKYLR